MKVLVRVTVAVKVGVRVRVPTAVMVGGNVSAVTEPVGVTDSVGIPVSVPKIPIGMTVAVPVFIGWRVKMESLHAGGVRISWLMGSTTKRRCFI